MRIKKIEYCRLFFVGVIVSFLLVGCGKVKYTYLSEETETTIQLDEEITVDDENKLVPVYVCGAVVSPGVYYISADAIKEAAIDAAGGFTEDASLTAVNLASDVISGEQIYVPTIEEASESLSSNVSDGKIHINRATKEELMTLPGIGESKADAILLYREQVGGFQKLEDIMNIPGIKQGVYDQIKEHIVLD